METAASTASTLATIRAADVDLKAFSALRGDDDAWQATQQLVGPLAGQWVAVKDIFDTADLPTSYGSPIYAGHQPAFDAAMVSILRRSGALVIGKSTTTEFAFLHPAATLNQAAPGCTPGGSSAGSAAAVAAGLVPLAVGSQTGGSTVRPASYCGIAGFKPSFGLLPTTGMKSFSWSLDTVGLFARTVQEVSAFAQAVSGQRIAVPPERRPGDWVIGVPEFYPWGETSASARKALTLASEVLREAGVRVVSFDLPPWAAQAFRDHDAIQGWEASRALATEMDRAPERLSPLLREYLTTAREITDLAYATAQASSALARDGCAQWLAGIDVILTPSAPDEPPEGLASTGASTFNRAWTLLGTPCLSVPGATGVNERPMGLQVIAPQGRDDVCLAAGTLLAQALLRP